MASSKRIGFYWGEEKITLVEFDKNAPLKVIPSLLATKSSSSAPFSSNLTEEIQITSMLSKIIEDNLLSGGSFYVSLPLKDIILRSFIIPFVRPEEIQNAIKFEAKKYMPFDIQELSFVVHTIPFSDGPKKQLQVIFYGARKEVLNRYQRIFMKVNAEVSYCEPYTVSLAKALLYKKEIKSTDQLAFLILDKNLGRICFIDQGIPQFIREFSIAPSSPAEGAKESEETKESVESLNSKIVNEVGNSFDFYARQFSGDRIDQMLVSAEFVQKDLLTSLETELKLKIKKFSPVVSAGMVGQVNDMDAIYAMGACVAPPMQALSVFNFLGDKAPKSEIFGQIGALLEKYKEILIVFVICIFVLGMTYLFFHMQLNNAEKQYELLSAKQGVFVKESLEDIQAEFQQNSQMLINYKDIRTKSEISYILLRIASHLPQGALLDHLDVAYTTDDTISGLVTIDMSGEVLKEDLNGQIAVVNQMFSDFKNDKELSPFIKSVNMTSLNLKDYNGRQVVSFNIRCS